MIAELMMVAPSTGWHADAACAGADGEIFFEAENARGDGRQPDLEMLRAALDLCARCPVAAECLAEALSFESAGVWAGTTADDRARSAA